MSHRCQLCGAAYKQIARLKSHLILHEEEKTYKCDFCDKLFSKSSNLYSHIRTHTGEKPYQCKVCKRFFPRLHNVRSHLLKIHGVNKCRVDEMILTTDKDTRRENDTDTKTMDKAEPLEDSVSSQNTTLYPVSNTGVDITSPPVSDTAYREVVSDTAYYTVHTETVTFCDDLGGSQENQAKRVYYKCKTCPKTLSHKSNMEDHVRSHTGVKLFKCRLCGKGLSRKQNLVHHLRHVHYIENSHVEQNIIRMKDPVTGRKIKRKRCKGDKLDRSIDCVADEFCESETVCDAIKQWDRSSGETSSPIKPESDELVSLDRLTDKGDDLLESDRESDDTISNISGLDESQLGVQSKFNESETQVLPNSDNMADGKITLGPSETDSDIAPSRSSHVTVPGVTEVKEDNLKNIEFNTKQKLGDEIVINDSEDAEAKVAIIPGERLEASVKTEASSFSSGMIDGGLPELGQVIDSDCDISNTKLESSDILAGDEDDDQMYEVLYPESPSLKMYRCRLCRFECKRRYYMAVEHVLKHSNYKPYLCVVCCKPYSRKYTLKNHLVKEHSMFGTELDNILATTGNKVLGNLPDSYKGTKTSTTEMDISSHPDDCNTNGEVDSLGNKKHSHSEDVNWLGINLSGNNEMGDHSAEESNMYEDLSKCSDKHNIPTSEERDMTIDTTRLNCSEVDNEDESVCSDIKSPKSDGASAVPKSPMTSPGSLPSFFTSVFQMMNSRQPKRPCQFNEKIKALMDLQNLTCLKCHKRCSNKSNLKQHVKFVHINQKEFVCFVCSKRFSTKFNLRIHLKQHGSLLDGSVKEEFACRRCGKTFTTKSYLRVHIVNKHGVFHTQSDHNTEITENSGMEIEESV